MTDDLGFDWREHKGGSVEILRDDRVVTALRGERAEKFLEKIDSMSPAEAQQMMARLAGNYKRGSEKSRRDDS